MISINGEKEAMEKLGASIRAERLRRNFSQQHVADLVGVSLPTYRKIEVGDGSVDFGAVARTLGVLGYSDGLASIISATQTRELTLAEALEPERQRASSAHRRVSLSTRGATL
jgi:transcriptional regulator with XRE-family HTH domain